MDPHKKKREQSKSSSSSVTSVNSSTNQNSKIRKGESKLWQSSITFTESSVEFNDNSKKDAVKTRFTVESEKGSSTSSQSQAQQRKSAILIKSKDRLAKVKSGTGSKSNMPSEHKITSSGIVFNKAMLSGTNSSRGSRIGSRDNSRPGTSGTGTNNDAPAPAPRMRSIPPSAMHSRTRLPGNNNNRSSSSNNSIVVRPLPIEIPDTITDPEGFQRYLARRRDAVFINTNDDDNNSGSRTPPPRLSQTSLDSHFTDF